MYLCVCVCWWCDELGCLSNCQRIAVYLEEGVAFARVEARKQQRDFSIAAKLRNHHNAAYVIVLSSYLILSTAWRVVDDDDDS